MPDSLCRLTVAACTDDGHRAVDLALPADIQLAALLPQIVDIVQGDTTRSVSGCDWRLARLGELPMDESMTLNDNDVRDGEVLLLAPTEPPAAERVDCDPCRVLAERAIAGRGAVPRILPALCCVLLGGFGAVALAWPAAGIATTTRIVTAAWVTVAAAAGTAVVRRRNADPLICVPLSLIAVLYAGTVGFLIAAPGPSPSGLLLAASAMFSAAILFLRVTSCGSTCLTTIATLGALIAAVATAGVIWPLQLHAGGAALVILALATLGFAPRLSMVLSGIGPTAGETVVSDADSCRETLTGLVVGASIAAALGAASVGVGEIHDDGAALRDVAFTAVAAIVLLLRARTHVDPTRRSGLVAAAVLAATAAFTATVASVPAQAHVVSALAATAGAATLSCLTRPRVSPILLRSVEIIEYVAIAAIVPLACWVSGVYGLAREMTLV